jgi:hypothetical protein
MLVRGRGPMGFRVSDWNLAGLAGGRWRGAAWGHGTPPPGGGGRGAKSGGGWRIGICPRKSYPPECCSIAEGRREARRRCNLDRLSVAANHAGMESTPNGHLKQAPIESARLSAKEKRVVLTEVRRCMAQEAAWRKKLTEDQAARCGRIAGGSRRAAAR